MKTVITYGTYDMFHIGHLNILKRAKALGDKLVGVTSENYDRARGKLNVVQDLQTRINTIKALPFVDEVIIEEHAEQKVQDIQTYNVTTFVLGDDWKGHFDYLKEYCEVIYLPRTENISSTLLRNTRDKISLGMIGTGRIAQRFVKELKFVNNLELLSVLTPSKQKLEDFLYQNAILYGFTKIEDFFASNIDAVYIASPHQFHYEQVKMALNAGKHVLCEKPIALKEEQLIELFELANKKKLTLVEALKTGYFPAFSKLLDEVNSGIIGEVQEVKATFTKLIEDRSLREWNDFYGGATLELGSYPLLLAQKIFGTPKKISYFKQMEGQVDSSNRIVCQYENDKIAILTVGIGMKSEGSAIISGTKGYIYVPAPWWLTKSFSVRFEDSKKEYNFKYEFAGDGLRYEIAEFASLISRHEIISDRVTQNDMLGITKVLSNFLATRVK